MKNLIGTFSIIMALISPAYSSGLTSHITVTSYSVGVGYSISTTNENPILDLY